MAEYIPIHLARMQTAAKQMRVQAGEYRRTGRQLMAAVSSSGGWEGADAQAFRSRLGGFEDDLEKMAKLMESYAGFLDQAAQAYRQAQESAVAQARNLWR